MLSLKALKYPQRSTFFSSLRNTNYFEVPEQCYAIREYPSIGYTAENIIYVNI